MSDLMIEVDGLTKRYAGATAVKEVSFSVARGETVGLLGKNGAGKSTILKILSAFLPATSGTARVAGLDVFHQADEVRRRIGYMPENNPLHMDMRVKEYLKFRARLKGLSMSQTRERVDTVLQQCALTDVHRRIIGQLSKGYKQRVGLADALVHEPELIILDEPTIGLDPNQIRSVRQLVKDLGKRHTILLSTHILSEVEMTCSHVLVLHRGRMLASDSIENLQRRLFESGAVTVEVAAPLAALTQCWAECASVQNVDITPIDGDYHRCILTARDGEDLRDVVFEQVNQRGWKLRELTRSRHTLEEIFVRMTKDQEEAFRRNRGRMSVEKTLEKVLRGDSDANIRFEELLRLLQAKGFRMRISGSHHIFTRTGVRELINLQRQSSHAKPYQVRQVRRILAQYKLL